MNNVGLAGTAKMHRSPLTLVSLVLTMLAAAVPARTAELVMFETAYCEWCQRWHEEIGPIYPRTRESEVAPLRRVDLDAPLPADLTDIAGIRFTPTFVVLDHDAEIGRITGYPGDAHFWGLLEEILNRLPTQSTSACKTVKEIASKC